MFRILSEIRLIFGEIQCDFVADGSNGGLALMYFGKEQSLSPEASSDTHCSVQWSMGLGPKFAIQRIAKHQSKAQGNASMKIVT